MQSWLVKYINTLYQYNRLFNNIWVNVIPDKWLIWFGIGRYSSFKMRFPMIKKVTCVLLLSIPSQF